MFLLLKDIRWYKSEVILEDNRTKTLWYCSNEQHQRDFYYSGSLPSYMI